jgi:hypothetical protein
MLEKTELLVVLSELPGNKALSQARLLAIVLAVELSRAIVANTYGR